MDFDFSISETEKRLIKREEMEIQKISSNLKVSGYSWSTNHVCSITTSFPLKGNKMIIEKLSKLGWVLGRRFKRRTDGGWTRNQYDGYEMMQYMHKYFS